MKLKTLKTSLQSAGSRIATIKPGSWRQEDKTST